MKQVFGEDKIASFQPSLALSRTIRFYRQPVLLIHFALWLIAVQVFQTQNVFKLLKSVLHHSRFCWMMRDKIFRSYGILLGFLARG